MQPAMQYPEPSGGGTATASGVFSRGTFRSPRFAALADNKVNLRLGALGRTVTIGTETYEVSPLWTAVNVAALGALAYHGYRRNRGSWGWALTWGLLGGLVWPITGAVALAQGFGEPKGRG